MLTFDEGVLLQYVTINAWHPIDRDWWATGEGRPRGLATVAALRSGEPLILEHLAGQQRSRVVTCLTAAGPLALPAENSSRRELWNNWASDENAAISFLVLQLELQKRIGRQDRVPPSQIVGEPIVRLVDPAEYRAEVEITAPDNRATKLTASPLPRTPGAAGSPPRGDDTVVPLQALYRDTWEPGIYTVALTRQDGTRELSLVACNVPPEESRLAVASNEELLRPLADATHIEIRAVDSEDWLQVEAPGNELRTPLLWGLLALLLLELYMAYRFSHHPVPLKRPATV
ncbi:MAG: hypothetical protein R3B90_11840 [Planctomycetaceae bacterium]